MADFTKAAQAGLITPDQAEALTKFFAEGTTTPAPARPRFDLPHVLWYAGALLIMGAMSWFTTLGFARMGGGFLVGVGVLYALAALALGERLWSRGLTAPGGLFVAVAVSMTPLIVYGAQNALGWWPGGDAPDDYRDFHRWIKAGLVPMEIATFAAAALAVRRYPFGFIAFVAAMAIWYFSMDLAQYLAGDVDKDWALRRKWSVWLGLTTIIFAWAVDLRQRKADYAFWLHLAGALSFWGALTLKSSDSELAKFGYCLINIGLIALALVLRRRVYVVFGVIGVGLYLSTLADRLFRDSLLFPFALTVLGIGVVALGLWSHRHGAALALAVDDLMPAWLRRLRPRREALTD